ncbi:hypothetical protein VD0002_g4573 [Verticillium dahliae]|uniref:Uncharacterized protein n=1 Tax=Verticillium dahliae TaxID=27337 RepID=A0AA45AP68_VERDA|nr:hypothetical protein VdG2_01048 [Verticillium dahliae VDG2]KAH6710252.1 hypothetical protein EV126DRAFT_18220 [Verticillium dahliae]PNH34272.1 hypothetical protein BJF96_g2393 [Verticillium dahliae]PNH56989.1 hypothetical protein VD0003_g831 [Verticillium dahliae]PNH63939.1 hypothetical protein VD0002_g4573 [Verticillium dahliae]
MAPYQNANNAPEVVQQSIPEVYHPQSAVSPSYHAHSQAPDPTGSPIKPEPATLHPGYTSSPVGDNHSQVTSPKAKRTFCGCTILVLILSIIIAALSAAVIGLAVGTGVQTNRANDAKEKLNALSAEAAAAGPATTTVTVSEAVPTETSFSAITHGCSDEKDATSGTDYTTHFSDKVTFTMFCNSNAPPYAPLLALAVPDFDRCMDACASYTKYIKGTFESDSDSVNATCTAVSFIPAWTSKEEAINANAEGNCYLKSGQQRRSALEPVKPGPGETHAAILSAS